MGGAVVDASAAIAHVQSQLTLEEHARAKSALTQRLWVAHQTIFAVSDVASRSEVPDDAEPMALLDALIARLCATLAHSEAWLIYIALSTVMPRMADVEALVRQATHESAVSTRIWLLGYTLPSIRDRGSMSMLLRVIDDSTVVDVNFSAKDEHNSGIQRVVRRTVPHWVDAHDVVLVGWTTFRGAMRTLSEREEHRVTDWDSTRQGARGNGLVEIAVPWRTRVILAEVPSRADMCDPISAMARFSGNKVSLIGYDAIPIVSAETVPLDMSDHFAKFLSLVKWCDSVAAISTAAATEFRGFANMLSAQGLEAPRVIECALPADAPRSADLPTRDTPLVVVVGSKEPRKNHVAILYAAERLWREGLAFDLHFIGTYGWDTREFRVWLKRLERAGRSVTAPQRVGDDALWRAYAEARFTMFPSLHEGYGLPVAESLAYGTPVITTDYGSTGEIAADGGCLVVDPRNDEEIVDAMRLLLTDDATLERLRAEARARPVKTWAHYAEEVWAVVGGSA